MPAGFLAMLQSFDSSYGCRTSKSAAPQLASAASPMNMMEKFMNMLVVNQHKMLEMSLHGGHNGGTNMGGLPSCLNPSAGSGGLNRALSLEWLPPRGNQLATFPGPLPPSAPPPTPPLASPHTPSMVAAQLPAVLPTRAADESQTLVTTPLKDSALQDVETFLDMVSSRKEAKAKAKSKAKNKKAKKDCNDDGEGATGDDEEEATAERKSKAKTGKDDGGNPVKRKSASPPSSKDSDEKKPKKKAGKGSKGKAKKSSKIRGLAKVAAEMKASKAKTVVDAGSTVLPTKRAAKVSVPSRAAVSASKEAAKDSVAERAVASATTGAAKESAAAKAAGKGNTVYTRGCAKCRWKSGCARCLALDYTGVRFSVYD